MQERRDARAQDTQREVTARCDVTTLITHSKALYIYIQRATSRIIRVFFFNARGRLQNKQETPQHTLSPAQLRTLHTAGEFLISRVTPAATEGPARFLPSPWSRFSQVTNITQRSRRRAGCSIGKHLQPLKKKEVGSDGGFDLHWLQKLLARLAAGDRASFIRGLSHTAALPIDAIFRHRAPHADTAAYTKRLSSPFRHPR